MIIIIIIIIIIECHNDHEMTFCHSLFPFTLTLHVPFFFFFFFFITRCCFSVLNNTSLFNTKLTLLSDLSSYSCLNINSYGC